MPDNENADEKGKEEPELMTMTEIAAFAQLSRQRVHNLSKEDPNWPAPAKELLNRRVYDRRDIERYFANRVKRQGERTDLKDPKNP